MARRLRVFVAGSAFVPMSWIDAVGAPPHTRQIDVIVVAPFKADAIAMLAARGMVTSRDGRDLRVNESWMAARQLRDVGIVGDDPIVITFARATNGQPVVRVDVGPLGVPTFTRLGRWEAGRQSGLIVHRERPVTL